MKNNHFSFMRSELSSDTFTTYREWQRKFELSQNYYIIVFELINVSLEVIKIQKWRHSKVEFQ